MTLPRTRPPSASGASCLLLGAIALTGACISSTPSLSEGEDVQQAAESATRRGDWRSAAHYWNQALLEGESSGPRPYLETARALDELDDPEGAQVLLDRGIELFPDDVELHLMRGRLLRRRGFRRAAELDFREVTEIAPENREAWFQLGRVLVELDLPARAAICLREHMKLVGADPEAQFLLGRAWADHGELALAVESFSAGLADPDCDVELLVAAASRVAEDRFARVCEPHLACALDWVDRALEIDPQYAEASHVRGCLLTLSGEDELAIEAFERAVELDNFHLPAMTRLAELYARRGDVARADGVIDRALDLNIASGRRLMLERLRASWHR